MANKEYKPIWSGDEQTLSNVLVKDKLETYNVVAEWYDGAPMDDSKIDSDLVYVKYEGKYLLRNFEYGQVLQKDTMDEMRNLSSYEILLLKLGVYKHVQLNGYYEKGDTPAPINYMLSDTEKGDNYGSVIKEVNYTLKHVFKTVIDLRYFGVRSEDRDFDNYERIQKALDEKKDLVLVRTNSSSFYISKPLRAWRSIVGEGMPEIIGRADINSPNRPEGTINSDFTLIEYINKVDEDYAKVEGLILDVGWDPNIVPEAWSEQEHCIRIACSRNVHVIGTKLLRPMGDGVNIGASIFGGEGRLIENSENCSVEDNVCESPYRMGVSVTGGKDISIKRNYINKTTPYVASIDLEVSRNSNVLHNIEVKGNRIIHTGAYAINVHGGIDYTQNDPNFIGRDYTTKGIRLENNIITNVPVNPDSSGQFWGRAINLAASHGSIKDVIVRGNRYESMMFIQATSYEGAYKVINVLIEDNKTLVKDSLVETSFGNIWYCEGVDILNNECSNVKSPEGCVDIRYSKNIRIEGNEFEKDIDREVISLRLGHIHNITIKNNNLRSKLRSAISFSTNASGSFKNIQVVNNPLIATDSPTHSLIALNREIEGLEMYGNNFEKGGSQNILSSRANVVNKEGGVFIDPRGQAGGTFLIMEAGVNRPLHPSYYGPDSSKPDSPATGLEFFNTSSKRPEWYYEQEWVKPVMEGTVTNEDSGATSVEGIVEDFNELLNNLRIAGVLKE